MVIILVIEVAGPYFKMSHELLSYFGVGVVDESGKVVDVGGRLVKIFDGDRVGISKAHQILEDECIIFPQTTPEDSGESI